MKKADILVSLIIVPYACTSSMSRGTGPTGVDRRPTLIPWGVLPASWCAGCSCSRSDRPGAHAGGAADRVQPATVTFAVLLTGGYAALVSYVGFLVTTFLYLLLFGLPRERGAGFG